MKPRFLRSGIYPLLAATMLVVAACDGREAATETEPQASAAVTETSEPAADSPGTADTGTSPEDIELRGVTETEGLASEPANQDDATVNEPAMQAAAGQTEWKYKEGTDYRRMATAQGTSSPPEKIEVAEVFWYGCPHCYDFDPIVTEWNSRKADNVAFVRIPVIWNPTNQAHARLMYTAEALGVLDKAHEAIFKAIHEADKSLTTEAEMIKLFADLGVEEAAFNEAFNSFGVTSAVKRAENLTRRYGIKSVPVIVVNGKYATDAPNIRTFDDMLNVTSELVAREQAELSAP